MTSALFCTVAIPALTALGALPSEPIEIGSRLELFVDGYLIGELSGGAELELHRPAEREAAIVHDQPWEGNASAYQSVFKDGDLYRMYYRGVHYRQDYPDRDDEQFAKHIELKRE